MARPRLDSFRRIQSTVVDPCCRLLDVSGISPGSEQAWQADRWWWRADETLGLFPSPVPEHHLKSGHIALLLLRTLLQGSDQIYFDFRTKPSYPSSQQRRLQNESGRDPEWN